MTIRKRVRIQPGGRVELQDDALPEGAEAEVTVELTDGAGDGAPSETKPASEAAYSLVDMIGAAPSGRSAEEIDRDLSSLRDEWD